MGVRPAERQGTTRRLLGPYKYAFTYPRKAERRPEATDTHRKRTSLRRKETRERTISRKHGLPRAVGPPSVSSYPVLAACAHQPEADRAPDGVRNVCRCVYHPLQSVNI